jgi:DNA (cytosine-5)-methyltransferase 1
VVSKPILFDICCGLGGATKGYQRAGFYVIGVDIAPHPDYCGDEFVQSDGLAFLVANGRDADGIHTSWPCQASSSATKGNRKREGWTDDHIDLNPAGRALLDAIGRPYVMENVMSSVLRPDVVLCGLMFGLRVFRHRKHELGGWSMPQPPMPSHRGHRVSGWRHGVKYEGDMLAVYGNGGGKATVEECREGLGIDWSWDRDQLVEAVPPAYYKFIGHHLMAALQQGEGLAA